MEDKQANVGNYCEIVVAGHLDETRLADVGEMLVSPQPGGQTLIAGQILDQAALFGILIRIRDMGVSLISVTCPEQAKT